MTSDWIQSCTSLLEVEVGSANLASILLKALEPETFSVPSERARTSLSIREDTLVIRIQAKDLTALRAAMNSYLAWVSGSLGAIESIDNSQSSV